MVPVQMILSYKGAVYRLLDFAILNLLPSAIKNSVTNPSAPGQSVIISIFRSRSKAARIEYSLLLVNEHYALYSMLILYF
jgi:hypothetical protein